MKIFFSILCIGFSIIASTQNALSGKITNINKEIIIGAEIYLPQIHKGTVSDFEGNYQFNNLPKGKIDIVITYMGYETLKTTIEITGNTTKDFILNESIFDMDEIIVSTPFNKLQSHNVMKVENIKLSNAKNIGAINLTEKMSEIPGITNIATGNGIGKPVIRGLSGNRVLVYTQGIRYENFQNGEKHGLGINENGIDNVEIIKGPASLLYGSDALGGVIYLVPEKFETTNKTTANLVSTFQSNSIGFNNSLGFKTTKDKFKFLVRGSYNTQSDYETAEKIRVTNSRFNDKDFKAGFGFENDKFNTDIRYNYNQSFNGITHEIDEQSTSKEIKGLYQKLNNHILSAKNTHYFNSFTLKTNLGFTHHNRNLFKDDVKTTDMDLNTINYDIKTHLLNTGNFETIFGIQGMYQTNKNHSNSIFLPDATIFDFGVFATSNYDLENNTIQAGIRFDNRNISTKEHGELGSATYFNALDKNLNNITGAIGLKSDLAKNLVSRLNLALGFRAPNLSELTSNGFHEGRFEFGNNDLKNENNFQIDANIEYGTKTIEFFINGFYNRIKNYIYLEPSGTVIDNFDVFTYSQDDSKLYGGEFGFHLHPINHKWIHLKSSGESVTGKIDNGEDLPRIPGFTIKNNMKFEFNINSKFDSNFLVINNKNVFKQTRISEHEDVGEAYTLFDIGLGSNFKIGKLKTTFSINVNNLFNKDYIDHLSVLKEENIANAGRNIVFSLDFNL